MTPPPSPESPVYAKVQQQAESPFWFITVDEGWRKLIVCDGMYEHVADWLLSILGRRPYPSREGVDAGQRGRHRD